MPKKRKPVTSYKRKGRLVLFDMREIRPTRGRCSLGKKESRLGIVLKEKRELETDLF